MEYDMRSSTAHSMSSERLNFERISSDSSSDDWSSYTSTRNQRKYFWKDGGYADNTMNEALIFQNYPKRKIKHKKETKAVCTFIRNKAHNIRQHPFENEQTTIKLTNVPVKMNNILDLYHCFNRFGIITLIQAQRNRNPYCAVISFLTIEDAKNAMENSKKIIPNVRAVWFTDMCLLTTSNANYFFTDDMYSSEIVNRCKPNDIIDLSDKLNCTQLFNSGDRNCTVSNNDMKYKQNLELLITELIRKKKRLLSHQMNSMREIIERMNKCEIGSRDEKILSELLKKVQDQVHENRKSIEYSIKQRTEYFAKQKYLSYPKPAENPISSCPPWISAFKAASAKRAETVAYEGKRRKSNRTVGIFQTASVINDEESSSSESERTINSSEESSSKYYSSNFCTNNIKRPRKFHASVENMQNDERYQCEMDRLLSDDSDVQDVD